MKTRQNTHTRTHRLTHSGGDSTQGHTHGRLTERHTRTVRKTRQKDTHVGLQRHTHAHTHTVRVRETRQKDTHTQKRTERHAHTRTDARTAVQIEFTCDCVILVPIKLKCWLESGPKSFSGGRAERYKKFLRTVYMSTVSFTLLQHYRSKKSKPKKLENQEIV